MNKKALIAMLLFLLIITMSGFAIARFKENKQPTKEYHKQEQLKTRLKLAEAQRDGFKEANLRHINEGGKEIETLEKKIAETEANNTRLQTKLNKLNVSRAVKRTTKRAIKPGVEQWRPLVEKYFLAEFVDDALRVMSGESGGNPNAKNPNSSASGLFQHLARYWPARSKAAGWAGASIYDPEANIAVAAWLSKGGASWSHWQIKP